MYFCEVFYENNKHEKYDMIFEYQTKLFLTRKRLNQSILFFFVFENISVEPLSNKSFAEINFIHHKYTFMSL